MTKRKTDDEFKREVFEKFESEYTILGTYTGVDKKVEVKHNLCDYSWSVSPTNFLRGASRCPNCSGKRRLTDQEFQEKLDAETNNQFLLICKYGGVSRKNFTTLKHKICEYEFTVSGSYLTFEKPIGCRKCSNMMIHDKDRVEMLLEDKYGREYTLLSNEVKNNRDKILIRHNECGESFKTTSNKIINQGSACPYCLKKGSKGELKIEKVLKQENISFIREFSFADCKHRGLLYYDFAIFNANKELSRLIEFDGRQHYEPVDFFGGDEGFNLIMTRDSIKDNYCKIRSIPLLRIPYFKEDEIEALVLNFVFTESDAKC